MNKKIFSILALLVVASMLLVACAPPAAAPTPVPPGVTPEEPPPVTDEFVCDDPIGCLDIAPGAAVRVAYFLVISGPDETLGIDSRRGIEIAIDDKGDILGHSIELTGEDDGCSPEGGQTGATRLAADPNLVAVIGTSCSSAAVAALPVISDAGLTMISPSNTAVALTLPENYIQGYARTAHSDSIQGAAAARFAREELGAESAATIHDGSIYAEQLQGVFAETFQELGGTITSQEAVGPDDTDMRPVLTRIAAGNPDIIYSPIFIRAGANVVSQRLDIAGLEETHVMVADGQFSPDFSDAAGDPVEGVYISSPDLAAFAGGYDEFVSKHQEKYGEPPISVFHAHAYDAASILFNAIESVAVEDADGSLHIPRQGLRDAVLATQNHQGLTGNLTCTETGDCADPQIAVYVYHAGQFPPERIWP